MSDDTAPQQLREEYLVRKFGGATPDALRPEDVVEEIEIVMIGGVTTSHRVTRAPAPLETTD